MRIAPHHGVIHGDDGAACPPRPYVEVEDAEARALIKRGIAYAVDGDVADDDAGGVVSFELLDEISESDEFASWFDAYFDRRYQAAIGEAANAFDAELARVAGERDAALAEVERLRAELAADPKTGEQSDDAAKRAAEIADALDLLEEDGFVKTGPRAGKPKIEAVAAITGYSVTVEEVDAAIAAKESGE